jgi:hypothetical protein
MTSLCPNCGEVPCATPEACGLKILPVKEAPLSDKQIEYRVSRAASLLRGLPGPGTLMEAMRLAERLGGLELGSSARPASVLESDPHVDDFIDRHGGDPYARFVLSLFRLPAAQKLDFAPWIKPYRLFCTYEGRRWRCTGASRLGDVWLRADPQIDHGYDQGLRVNVMECSAWGPTWEVAPGDVTGGPK